MDPTFQPGMILLALWPTAEFVLPADGDEETLKALAQRLRAQVEAFDETRIVRPQQPGMKMPPDVPRLALLGKQTGWALELAPAKVMLRLQSSTPQKLDPMFAAMVSMVEALYPLLTEMMNLRAYRLGAVAQFFCRTPSSANEKLARYFLQPRALQGQAAHDVQLGLLARLALENGMMINRWLRARPLRTNDERKLDMAAQLEIDINTMAEDTTVKGAREIVGFIEAVHAHLRDDLPILDDPEFLA